MQAIVEGYRCADLLLRLPGAIPLPSFSTSPSLPSPQWVDPHTKTFKLEVSSHLTDSPTTYTHHPCIPFPPGFCSKPITIPRQVLAAPLIVRAPNAAVYTAEGRRRLLDSLGVPVHLHDPDTTKILLVSFGGQVFHKPHSRSHSRSPSASTSPRTTEHPLPIGARSPKGLGIPMEGKRHSDHDNASHAEALSNALQTISLNTPPAAQTPLEERAKANGDEKGAAISRMSSMRSKQIRGQSQLVVAGAPPASILASPTASSFAQNQNQNTTTAFTAINIHAPTPDVHVEHKQSWLDDDGVEEPQLFPDENWIAVVCGVSKEWGKEDGEELPDNFFVAPKDVYMPDLTAVADVLLGKLASVSLYA